MEFSGKVMNMEVEIISRETIKPSSPTPHHLRTFNLSLLDKLSPTVYVPIIFFYNPISENHLQIISRLKKSLSEALTRFYPLAGRVKDHLFIDCNDDGVSYSEARVNCHMSQFLKQPQLQLLTRFLPSHPNIGNGLDPSEVQLTVQVNIFDCGGIAIGALILHKIVDGTTMSVFFNTWASMARGSYDEAVYPDLAAASSLFPRPPRDLILPSDHLSLVMEAYTFKEGKYITRRFVFDAKVIATLKAKATSQHVPNPSRVEVVSGFIWKRAMAASKVISGSPRPSIVAHTVNLRPRMVPPLPAYSVGNLYWMVVAPYKVIDAETSEIELHDLVSIVRGMFAKINGDYVKKLQGDQGGEAIFEYLKELREIYCREQTDSFGFTSWCKMGLNEVDFGWGKPIWVGIIGDVVSSVFKNLIALTETRSGDGIEAWVTLNEQEMVVLERDPEFLAFASPNPSILD